MSATVCASPDAYPKDPTMRFPRLGDPDGQPRQDGRA